MEGRSVVIEGELPVRVGACVDRAPGTSVIAELVR